jgi:hypothetical protein
MTSSPPARHETSARRTGTKRAWLKALPWLLFVASCVFVGFAWGVCVGEYQWFPYHRLRCAARTIRVWTGTAHRHHHLAPLVHEQFGVTAADRGDVQGVTLLTSYWDRTTGLRLIDARGNVLNHWRVDPSQLWPRSPHDDLASGSKNHKLNYIHGAALLDGGDVVFNIEHLGLVRMSPDGHVVWKLPRRTHHAVTPDEHGNLWVCGMRFIEDPADVRRRFPGLIAPVCEDCAMLVSPDGQVLREFSVLEALFARGAQRLIWRIGHTRVRDVLHLNDVEALPTAIADQYPTLSAGDLVVSMRNICTVAVLDGQTGRIKWLDSDTFIRQHDPDFIGDGWVRVLDNNTDASPDGRWLGGSRIVDIRPHTGERRVVYPTGSRSRFYTRTSGKSQTLPNGHLLITETRAGRAFQVDPRGRCVWQWVQAPWPDDPSRVAEVMAATRYEVDPQTARAWFR